MEGFLELTPTTATAEARKLRIAVDSIESYRSSPNMRDPHETIVRTKTGEVHYVDESVAVIDQAISRLAQSR